MSGSVLLTENLGATITANHSTLNKIQSLVSKGTEASYYYSITRRNSVVRVEDSSRDLPVSD